METDSTGQRSPEANEKLLGDRVECGLGGGEETAPDLWRPMSREADVAGAHFE